MTLSVLLATLPSFANSTENSTLAPALFMGHGTPLNAFNSNQFTDDWEKISKIIKKPKAILVVSAHWETTFSAVSTNLNPPTIYDFYGFPDFMYNIKYEAKGAPEIATSIVESFSEKIFKDPNQGLDHGAWSVLLKLFPNADVPVFQFSLAQSMSPTEHFRLSQEMRKLREQGVMILGSGNIVHNIPSARKDSINGTRQIVHEWAKNFDDLVVSKINQGDYKSLANYEKISKDAKMAVPTPEHVLPLLYVLGATNKNEKAQYFAEGFQEGSFSMRSVLFS